MGLDTPVLTPLYVHPAQKLSGKITGRTWLMADCAGDFRLVGSHSRATQQTEVRVCYDRSGFYFRAECFEEQMDSLTARYPDNHPRLALDDCLEILICPCRAACASKCHRFVISASGATSYACPDVADGSRDWRAAVVRLQDRWTAEVLIPYSALRPLGRNEDCWRINFRRNERPRGETSTWWPLSSELSLASQLGVMSPPDDAPARFNTYRGKPVVLAATSSQPGTEPVSAVHCEFRSSGCLVPEPQEAHRRLSKGVFRIAGKTRIIVNDDPDDTDLATARLLSDAVVRIGGPQLAVVSAGETGQVEEPSRNAIIIGEAGRNPLLARICERESVRMPRSRYHTGAYVVDVTPERAVMTGPSQRETLYAVRTAIQLISAGSDGSPSIASVLVRDFPRFAFRGVQLHASASAIDHLPRLIDNVLGPLKISHIVLQADRMAWQCGPDPASRQDLMPREHVRELLAVARANQIALTPLIPSPGRFEWAFAGGANLDIAEDAGNPTCYCMSNPKSYEFMRRLIDEAMELFGGPDFVHLGRDAFDAAGDCASVGRERLYIEDTIHLRDHLRSCGSRMMMCGSLLRLPDYQGLLDALPRDIAIVDHCPTPSESYPTLGFFRSSGFDVIACSSYDLRNIRSLYGYASNLGAHGTLQALDPNCQFDDDNTGKCHGQIYSFVPAASWAWNPVRPNIESLPYRPRAVFESLLRRAPETQSRCFRTVRIEHKCNISRCDSGRAMGWLGIGRGNDLRDLPDGVIRIEGVPYRVLPGNIDAPAAIMLGGDGLMDEFPTRVDELIVGSTAKALHFLQGTAHGAQEGAEVGRYIVHYRDGDSAVIALRYHANIFAWDDQCCGGAFGFAWQTKAQDGRTVGVCALEWPNPHPEREITRVDFTSDAPSTSPFLLAITAEL